MALKSSYHFTVGFHLIVFIIDLFALYYDFFIIDIGRRGFGGKFKFLTVWNICLQTFYFGFSVVNDLSQSEQPPRLHKKGSTMQRWRDNFHATIAFPVGLFVVATFWALYAIDRDLVYPKALDKIIPPSINHILHSTILPFLLVDKVLVYHHYPRRLFGMMGTLLLACCYLLWILFIAFYDNFWVYPVLQVLKSYERAIFMSICLLLFAPLYIIGEKISEYIWCKFFCEAVCFIYFWFTFFVYQLRRLNVNNTTFDNKVRLLRPLIFEDWVTV